MVAEQKLINGTGGCHCKAVRFEFLAPSDLTLYRCNCSVCTMVDFVHLIVPKQQFKLLTPETDLGLYTFGSGVAKHYFCHHCGIKSFYIPRSNPDGVSISWRCVDEPRPDFPIEPFDGQNWEKHADSLKHLA